MDESKKLQSNLENEKDNKEDTNKEYSLKKEFKEIKKNSGRSKK